MARPGKGENRGESREPVDHSVEWTTSWGGKHGKGRNWVKSREPVVHFVEWTTSWAVKAGKIAETGEKAVSQWSTLWSGPLAGPARWEKCRNRGESREPVDHFVEWTTSWVGKAGKGQETGEKPRASGPL